MDGSLHIPRPPGHFPLLAKTRRARPGHHTHASPGHRPGPDTPAESQSDRVKCNKMTMKQSYLPIQIFLKSFPMQYCNILICYLKLPSSCLWLASPGGHRSHSHNHSMARGKKVKFPGRPGRATEQRAGHTLTVFKMVEIELRPDNTHNHEGWS